MTLWMKNGGTPVPSQTPASSRRCASDDERRQLVETTFPAHPVLITDFGRRELFVFDPDFRGRISFEKVHRDERLRHVGRRAPLELPRVNQSRGHGNFVKHADQIHFHAVRQHAESITAADGQIDPGVERADRPKNEAGKEKIAWSEQKERVFFTKFFSEKKSLC
jgi:hypothetical protein